MNRPTLHRAIYLDEAERALQSDAWLEVDALLAKFRQHDTSGCAVVEDEPHQLSNLQVFVIVVIWCAAMYGTGWLAGFVP
jgi:hypothetical protein